MPGKRRGQQALSPILESAADEDAEVAEESAAPKTKGRGKPSKAKPTGERHQGPKVILNCLQLFRRAGLHVMGYGHLKLLTVCFSAGKGKAKAAKTHDAVDGAPDAADCEPVSPP